MGGGGVTLDFFRAFLPGWAEDLSSVDATFFAGGGPATAFTDWSLAFFGGFVTVLAEAAVAIEKAAAKATRVTDFMAISCLT